MNELELIELFCLVDDFCTTFEPEWQKIQIESREKIDGGYQNETANS